MLRGMNKLGSEEYYKTTSFIVCIYCDICENCDECE
jgi:hypothetical protein